MKRFWAVLVARNKEFIRDRSALAWNLLFPFLVVFGFAFMFTGRAQDVFKVGVIGEHGEEAFFETEHIQFIGVDDRDKALGKVSRHQLDMLLDMTVDPPRYWINSTSPKGYILEKILRGAEQTDVSFQKETVEGGEIRYVDWLVPGLLALNMMFSCLFGVGYVIVRYRKNGVLRRMKATPLTAFEFLAAQVGSRLLIVIVVTAIIYVGAFVSIHFQMIGSHVSVFLVFTLGAMCLISLGLLIAARIKSEELAGGLLNLATWPMMFMSGVWFSLEGTPEWVQKLSKIFPLTHMVEASRLIMTEGATLRDVYPSLLVLIGMTIVFLGLGALLFRWE